MTFGLLLLLTMSCSVAHPRAREDRSATAITPSASPVTTGTPAPAIQARPYAVGWRRVTFVDRSRTVPVSHTDSGEPAPRVLVTEVWYPANGPVNAPARRDASPALAAGPFPLVLFAPGFDRGPSSYAPLLAAWARAGYVVASPSFPLTNPAAVGGLNERDIVHQPGDLSFLITELTRATRTSRGAFVRLIDPARVAVAGHSDGADTALVAADGSCCTDTRIDAVIVMAGAALPFGGRYFTQPGPPLLVMQGSADDFNPPSFARQLFREAPTPKYLLWMPGADHLQPFVGRGPLEAIVRMVTIGFLDRYVGGHPLNRVHVPLNGRNLASLSVRL
jgi:dienelactone hydrolase